MTRPRILFFSSDSCGACKQFQPVYDTLESKFRGRAQFEQIKVNTAKGRKLCINLNVEYVPTIYLVRLNKEKKEVFIKFRDQRDLDTLSRFIEQNI